MSRLRTAGLVALGLVAIVGAIAVAFTASPGPAGSGPSALGVLVVLVGLALALVKLWRDPDEPAAAPAPWHEGGELAAEAPERTPDEDRVSGTALTAHAEAARDRARSGETVAEATTAVGEPLREALIEALVVGGRGRDAARRAVDEGTWTDDPVAAAVLSPDVAPPERSLRRRVSIWLFPERAVRRRTRRAVSAVAAVADDDLPPVVGQRAPRPVPVLAPPLEDLQRAADGELQRADEVLSVGGFGVGDATDGEGNASARDPTTDPEADTDRNSATDPVADTDRATATGSEPDSRREAASDAERPPPTGSDEDYPLGWDEVLEGASD